MGKIFYISDLHFGHENVLAYDNRPFKDVKENDTEIIRRWNEAVGIDDEVWVLGDISWHNATKTIEIFNQLNGIKHLCIGNHDNKFLKNREIRNLFIEIVNYKEIQMEKTGIVLCHYPIPCFNHHYYGWYHFYGHVHTSFEWNIMQHIKYQMENLYEKPCNMYNIGCMVPYMDYTPKTFEEIVKGVNKTGRNGGNFCE